MKKIPMTQKPSVVAATAVANDREKAADAFVNQKHEENTKRLTIDMPEYLHTAVMTGCARRKLKVAKLIRAFLEQEFAAEVESIEREQAV